MILNFNPKVVAAATSLEEAAEAASMGVDIIEARIDLLRTPYLRFVKNVRDSLKKPLIITVRPEWEGGKFAGSEQDRLHIFRELIGYADYIDVELRAPDVDSLVALTKGTEVVPIISYHDFEKTPSNQELLFTISKAVEKGGVAKVAVMPQSLEDVLRLYGVALHAKRPAIVIAMGDIGAHSRIMAPVYGSIFTYGYVKKPVAPGQMRVDKILEGLRLLGLR